MNINTEDETKRFYLLLNNLSNKVKELQYEADRIEQKLDEAKKFKPLIECEITQVLHEDLKDYINLPINEYFKLLEKISNKLKNSIEE